MRTSKIDKKTFFLVTSGIIILCLGNGHCNKVIWKLILKIGHLSFLEDEDTPKCGS